MEGSTNNRIETIYAAESQGTLWHKLAALDGDIQGTDGTIGSVRGFMADDRSWAIQQLVGEGAEEAERDRTFLAAHATEKRDRRES